MFDRSGLSEAIISTIFKSIHLLVWYKLQIMASIGSCLKETIKIVFFLTIYLILEISVLVAILVTSVILTTWVSRTGLYIYNLDRNQDAVDHQIFELIKAIMVSWFIFIITLQWTRHWQTLMIPSKLQEFQRKSHPRLCAVLRNIIVPLLILLCTCCQICSFFSKFYRKRPMALPKRRGAVQEEANDGFIDKFFDRNDLAFLGSMWLLVYLSVRVFRFYKHVEMSKVVKEVGWEQAQCPTWRAYCEYFCMTLTYELFLTDICVLVFLGIGVIFQDNSKLFCWFPYIFTCMISLGFGIVIGDVEERLPWLKLKNRLGFQTYFRMIHWDARGYLLSLFLIPLLAFSYFRSRTELEDKEKDRLLHNLLHMAFVANIWMCITKGQTLFSYVIRGHYWRNRRCSRFNHPGENGRNGRARQCSNNRVSPQFNRTQPSIIGNNGAPSLSAVVDHNGNLMDKHGIVSIMKKVYWDYFPLYITKNENATGDQGSVSTGTCTSLLNRQAIVGNVEATGVVPEVPRSLEGIPPPLFEISSTPPMNDVECERGE